LYFNVTISLSSLYAVLTYIFILLLCINSLSQFPKQIMHVDMGKNHVPYHATNRTENKKHRMKLDNTKMAVLVNHIKLHVVFYLSMKV